MQQKVEAPTQFVTPNISPVTSSETTEEPDDYDDGVWATGGRIMMVSIGLALIFAVMTFLKSGEALFAVVIAAAYTVVFFAIPALMLHIRTAHDTRWKRETPLRRHHIVSINTGSIGRREAVLQMVIVPVGVAFAFAAFGLIWILARPW